MGSLTHKNDGRWIVRWYDAAGLQRQRTLEATTKKQAEREGHRLLAQLENKVERQRLGLDPRPSDLADLTFGQLFDSWWEEKGRHLRAKALKESLEKHLAQLRPLPLPELTAARVEALLASKQDTLSPASLNKLRSKLSQMFTLAAIPGGVWEGRPNPIASVPKRKVSKKPHNVLRLEEVPGVLAEIPDRPNERTKARGELSRCLNPRAICATALFTGMRKGELGGLLKADVNLADGTIRVCRSWDAPRTKDGKFSLIPIATGLRPYLEAAMRDAPGELVFPAEDGSMMPLDVDLEGMLQRAIGRAGSSRLGRLGSPQDGSGRARHPG